MLGPACAVQQVGKIGGLHAADLGAVHLDHPRHRAIERAIHLLDRDRPFTRGVAGADAQPLFARRQQRPPARHPAAHARAHPNEPRPGLGEPHFRIIMRSDAVHLAEAHTQMRRDRRQRLRRHPPRPMLRRMQRRQQPGPFPRKGHDVSSIWRTSADADTDADGPWSPDPEARPVPAERTVIIHARRRISKMRAGVSG